MEYILKVDGRKVKRGTLITGCNILRSFLRAKGAISVTASPKNGNKILLRCDQNQRVIAQNALEAAAKLTGKRIRRTIRVVPSPHVTQKRTGLREVSEPVVPKKTYDALVQEHEEIESLLETLLAKEEEKIDDQKKVEKGYETIIRGLKEERTATRTRARILQEQNTRLRQSKEKEKKEYSDLKKKYCELESIQRELQKNIEKKYTGFTREYFRKITRQKIRKSHETVSVIKKKRKYIPTPRGKQLVKVLETCLEEDSSSDEKRLTIPFIVREKEQEKRYSIDILLGGKNTSEKIFYNLQTITFTILRNMRKNVQELLPSVKDVGIPEKQAHYEGFYGLRTEIVGNFESLENFLNNTKDILYHDFKKIKNTEFVIVYMEE